MQVVVAAKYAAQTGNNSSAERIVSYLTAQHQVEKFDLLTQVRSDHQPEAVLGLHALACADYFKQVNVPKAVIFGGTDLNCDYTNLEQQQKIDQTVSSSLRLVAFSTELRHKALSLWPEAVHKLVVIPQAVTVNPSTSFILRERIALPAEAQIYLLPTGLRYVKDPLFLLEAFSDWHKVNQNIFLVICAADRDFEYAQHCKAAFDKSAGVKFIGVLDQSDLHAAMQQSTAILNSSISEGNCLSILEAMTLGIPVIARKNQGNANLISDQCNGFLFDSPEQCVEICANLAGSNDLREYVVANAFTTIAHNHSIQQERHGYLQLVESLKLSQ